MLPITRTHKPDTIELAKWSFWPEEWKRTKRSHPMINARVETAAEKPMSLQARHCLVLADNCYEWRQVGTRKQPYRITLKTGEPFAMAGIYTRKPTEFDTAEKNPVIAILTTQANDAVSYIHDRMPVILPLGCEKNWLRAKIPARTPHQRPRHPHSHRAPRTRNRCMMSTTITISLLA